MPKTYLDYYPKGYKPSAGEMPTYDYLKGAYPDASETTDNSLLSGSDLAGYYENQRSRIPNGNALEGQSSEVIAGLLNPPDYFPEVDRRSAESGTARGVSGSSASYSTGVRMTDEERLKRLSLGQSFLTAASNRNPAIDPAFLYNTPYQSAQIKLEKDRLELQRKAAELDNEMKRLQIRNLSRTSFGVASGGGRVSQPPSTGASPVGASLDYGGDNFHGTAPIGGGFQNTTTPQSNFDPNWDY